MANDTSPGPPRIQIQTQSACNGRCVFCPYEEAVHSGLPQGRMAPELYRKIIDELAELRPRRISLYLMNEPLLDDRLPEFTRYAAEKAPDATTLITSNGTLLDEARAEALIDAGLKRFKVSLQSLDSEINRKLMRYKSSSEDVVANVLAMKRVKDRKRAKHFDLRVSTIITNMNEGEIPAARKFWKKHGIRFVTSALENRGGNSEAASQLNPHAMQARGGYCIRPVREMCILFNGDVVLCCVDWFRTVVVGNVARQSIREIWNGPPLERIRKALRENAPGQPPICRDCTESACPDSHRRGLKGLLNRLR